MAKQVLNSQPSKKSSNGIKEVEAYLELIFQQKEADGLAIDAHYANLIGQASRLVARGGKRMRPQLVISSYQAFGGSDRQAIVKVAASQELFHAFALMHDDIIDRDVIRWGGPNISGHYLQEFSGLMPANEARHYADSLALLAGDLCVNLSFEVLANSGFTPSRTLKAVQIMQQTMFAMIGGEFMDVAASIYSPSSQAHDDSHFIRLYQAKTASYSFCMPLRLGALLAGAGASYDKHLDAFGYHLGVAFQIKDDILGIYGDEGKMGKSTLSDIREGRQTMLMGYGLKFANDNQKQVLLGILGNPKATYRHLKTIQSILKASGALEKTELMMQHHRDEARNVLLRADFPMALNDYLADLLSFAVKRGR